jgi:uroporphyrinogen III methyltransferase/synthase
VIAPAGAGATADPGDAEPRFDSEALLAAIAVDFGPDGLDALSGRRVLLVRGDGGRELLADTLRAHGAQVEAVAAYRRLTPEPKLDAWQRVHRLLGGEPHAWLLTSSEGVRNLDNLARDHLTHAEIDALKGAPVIAPHARIAETARRSGFVNITVSGAGDAAIVRALHDVLAARPEAAPQRSAPDRPSDGASAADAASAPAPGLSRAPSQTQTHSQRAQSRMIDSKDSKAAAATAGTSGAQAVPPLPPNVPFTPYEEQKRRRFGSGWLPWLVVLLVIVAAGAGGFLLNGKLERVERRIAAHQQSNDARAFDTRIKTDQTVDRMHQVDSQLAALSGKVSDMQTQQAALQMSLQQLAGNRDDWTLAEVEQTISAASQQLQLTGNVPLALFALQSADARLAASNSPQVVSIRKAIAQDIDKLKQTPNIDLTGLAIKLDDAIAQIDTLPLTGEVPRSQARPHLAPLPAASAPSAGKATDAAEPAWKTWMRTFVMDVRAQLESLVSVRRIDNADAMLIAPDQGYFLRENLKMRLLSARLALLSRNEATLKSDLHAADAALARYFDAASPATRNTRDLLRQVDSATTHVDLPNLNTSLDALHQVKGRG